MAYHALMNDWNHTAALYSLIFNAHRAKGVAARTPDQCHPMLAARSNRVALHTGNVELLKQLAGHGSR